MKKMMIIMLTTAFMQHTPTLGMLTKKTHALSKKKLIVQIKPRSEKTTQFNYDEIVVKAMQQIEFLKTENRSLKLTLEHLLAHPEDREFISCYNYSHTQDTIDFTSGDQRSNGGRE